MYAMCSVDRHQWVKFNTVNGRYTTPVVADSLDDATKFTSVSKAFRAIFAWGQLTPVGAELCRGHQDYELIEVREVPAPTQWAVVYS